MKINVALLMLITSILHTSCKNDKLAVAGSSSWNEIAIIDKASGLIEWKHTLEAGETCDDVEVTPNGNVLYAYTGGARLITRNHETVWDYKADENEEIHTAKRLKDGNFMLGISGEPARIVELDATGKQVREVKFPTLVFDVHAQFRQVFKTDSGVYLIPIVSKFKIMRVSEDGQLKGIVPILAKPYSVVQHKTGNLIVSCPEDRSIFTVNPYMQQIENYRKTTEIKGATIQAISELHLFDNENLMFANSKITGSSDNAPLVVEINDKFEVVWTLPYNPEIKNVTSVFPFKE
ncbi:MAG: hypothetical protein LBD53_04540 [Tannerella sp.]|jgi:hypothetical protein|nr:hypothetical protein [Tannerella sp.]